MVKNIRWTTECQSPSVMTMTTDSTPRSGAHHHRAGARDWSAPPPRSSARAFHRTLSGYAPTRLAALPEVARDLGLGQVLVKDETNRLGLPAFKVLGASWAVHQALSALEVAGEPRPPRLTTATDGNHGRALARTGALLGIPATIFIPDGVHPQAADAIRAEGAEVVATGLDYDGAVAAATAYAHETGALLVQDTAWPGYEEIPAWIVEGYRTLVEEVDEQLAADFRAPDLVVIPVGVGSLAQGVIEHYRAPGRAGRPALLAVEPVTAACVLASRQAGEPLSVTTTATTMAGLNCGTPSSAAWPALSGGLDAVVSVTDSDARAAQAILRAAGVDAGPCGAAPLAGLLAMAATGALTDLDLPTDATVVLLCTEGAAANPA